MANRKNWLGILVIVLVFGMTVFGCEDDSGGTDPALNGTWVMDNMPTGSTAEYTFNNGNYEAQMNGTPQGKGTYTTSGNKITITITHMYGTMYGLESRWYTIAEISALLGDYLSSGSVSQTATYSVSGNKLTMTPTNPQTGKSSTATYTKK
ncbi:hypothetical protein R84B8_02835 [Treponema sp. R8-4-B8]